MSIKSDRQQFIQDHFFQADGSVALKLGNLAITQADRILIDEQKHIVRVYAPPLSKFKVDHNGAIVWARECVIDGKAQKIVMRDPVYTPCDNPVPHWSVCAQRATMRAGCIFFLQPSFRLKRVPLIWLPGIVVPIFTSGKHGFLMPKFSYNARHGVGVQQRWFWSLGQENQIVLGLDWRQRRGWKMLGDIDRTTQHASTHMRMELSPGQRVKHKTTLVDVHDWGKFGDTFQLSSLLHARASNQDLLHKNFSVTTNVCHLRAQSENHDVNVVLNKHVGYAPCSSRNGIREAYSMQMPGVDWHMSCEQILRKNIVYAHDLFWGVCCFGQREVFAQAAPQAVQGGDYQHGYVKNYEHVGQQKEESHRVACADYESGFTWNHLLPKGNLALTLRPHGLFLYDVDTQQHEISQVNLGASAAYALPMLFRQSERLNLLWSMQPVFKAIYRPHVSWHESLFKKKIDKPQTVCKASCQAVQSFSFSQWSMMMAAQQDVVCQTSLYDGYQYCTVSRLHVGLQHEHCYVQGCLQFDWTKKIIDQGNVVLVCSWGSGFVEGLYMYKPSSALHQWLSNLEQDHSLSVSACLPVTHAFEISCGSSVFFNNERRLIFDELYAGISYRGHCWRGSIQAKHHHKGWSITFLCSFDQLGSCSKKVLTLDNDLYERIGYS